MKLKKLLLLNSLFFILFISCIEQKKSKEKTITVVEEKQKKENKTNSITNIVAKNKDTVNQNKIKISTTKKHPITDSLMVKKTNNTKAEDEIKPYPDPNDNGPKVGTFYIINPEQRINDSINIFVSMYDKLIANIENKGITNQKEKDSIIWEHWQKQIMENDYRHKHISFSEYWKNKE